MAEAKLIVKPPHMNLRMKPGLWPDLPRMLQTIRDAGYKPIDGGVDLIVTGKVLKRGDDLTLHLEGMRSPMSLRLVPAKDDAETVEHLKRHEGQVVELEGRWSAPAEGMLEASLAVTAIRSTRPAKP